MRNPELHVAKEAVLSPCGLYRYRLGRSWGPAHARVAWVMLNPSTADASVDDPTIRRCESFARTWHYSGMIVVNLYALRATDPKQLRGHPDPVGPDNSAHLQAVLDDPTIFHVVAAWGTSASPPQELNFRRLVRNAGRRLYSLGTTKHGHPRHPLYVKGTTVLSPWPDTTTPIRGAYST